MNAEMSNLTSSEQAELIRVMANPVVRKYINLVRTEAINAIALTPPKDPLEVHYREVRFTQGIIHFADTALTIGGMSSE